jgi:hypothetical protein
MRGFDAGSDVARRGNDAVVIELWGNRAILETQPARYGHQRAGRTI